MQFRRLIALVATAATLPSSMTTTAEPITKSWTLYHSIQGEFRPRSTITMEITAATGEMEDAVKMEITNLPDILNVDVAKSILDQPMYQIKLVENDAQSHELISSVPSCFLRRANYRDELVLNMGPKGHVLSLQYMPLISPLAPKTCSEYASVLPENGLTSFTSTVSWDAAVPGMTLRTVFPDGTYKPPPGLKRIPGSINRAAASSGGAASGAGVFGDEKKNEEAKQGGLFGFFQRYWYILLPMLVMNLMTTEAPPEGQPQQGQGGPPQQGQPAPAAGGGAPKARRGKRD